MWLMIYFKTYYLEFCSIIKTIYGGVFNIRNAFIGCRNTLDLDLAVRISQKFSDCLSLNLEVVHTLKNIDYQYTKNCKVHLKLEYQMIKLLFKIIVDTNQIKIINLVKNKITMKDNIYSYIIPMICSRSSWRSHRAVVTYSIKYCHQLAALYIFWVLLEIVNSLSIF